MAVAALLGWLALALQFYLVILHAPPGAMPVAAAVASYFSFFTILTNLLAALVLTFSARGPDSKWGKFFRRPTVQSATAVYIAIVGVTYSLLLRHLWNPQGAQKLADVLLHDAMPVIYVGCWLIFVPKGGLRWKDAIVWLAYPGIYLVYLLLRGAIFGLYPYPFIDVSELGYGRALVNAAMFVAAFFFTGLVAVGVGRWTARRQVLRAQAAAEVRD